MPRGNPKHRPTDEQRRLVKAMNSYGIPQTDIAAVIDIDPKTLRLHYRRELDVAIAEANAVVAQSLFNMATKGQQVAAAIFWLKTRAQWREIAPSDTGGPEIKVTGGLPDK